jgi:hypothetical protein
LPKAAGLAVEHPGLVLADSRRSGLASQRLLVAAGQSGRFSGWVAHQRKSWLNVNSMEILAFLVLLALLGVIAVALVVLGLGGAAIVANHYHQPGEDVPRGVGVLEDPQKAPKDFGPGNVITWGIVIAINVGWITPTYTVDFLCPLTT